LFLALIRNIEIVQVMGKKNKNAWNKSKEDKKNRKTLKKKNDDSSSDGGLEFIPVSKGSIDTTD